MKRNLLNEGFYTATILQANLDTVLELIWVVDSGEDKGAKVFQRFDTSSRLAVEKFQKLCDSLMFFLPKLYQLTESEVSKLVGLRAKINVKIIQRDNVMVNAIATYEITEGEPELDIFKEKTDEIFKHSTKKRGLPIL